MDVTPSEETCVAIVGLGYVGLPLALAFGQGLRTIGYERATAKVAAYRDGIDPAGEIEPGAFRAALHLSITDDPAALSEADVIIVTVPTPVDDAQSPDFGLLTEASALVGRHMRPGATVVFESTVYPGATEEVCVPVLERHSGLRWKTDFWVGYSPERINPGDREHSLAKVVKIVAGDTPETLDRLTALYGTIIEAGIHATSSIRVAEAAKVIENTQRDLNIALMNELSQIFDKLDLDTLEVLRAASTKWNFMPFRPGLVGGHCIGVDPYYLTHKAAMVGHHPQVILAGRRINDSMAAHVARKTVKLIVRQGARDGGGARGAKVIVLGLTFKENCSDLRNSKVADLVRELAEFGCAVSVHDPRARKDEARAAYGIDLIDWADLPDQADAVVVAVPHRDYAERPPEEIAARLKAGGLIVDVKALYDPAAFRALGHEVWRL
ncbi:MULTISPECIES: nucleotide sugar dehydrogenase [unclassified Methylobacterium]|uniref:nucleotide sugar dehydrogenase n=1 Tax=unclassified Methylobacterium TaxID=2615210 RepID=UPI0011C2079B|nr:MULTISPECIES: nucleotide sugar dehydrogenase [unclassified Methylobacterium]QEE39102.1 nucleotide sugar dehydrogenase [Methylobacterium sp. WL1]TXN55672.1 nucleotide sugar dehydrogenase [Methylobacterium sp. WL2]